MAAFIPSTVLLFVCSRADLQRAASLQSPLNLSIMYSDNAGRKQEDGSTEDLEDHAGLPEGEHEDGHDRGYE